MCDNKCVGCDRCLEQVPVRYWSQDRYKGVRYMTLRLYRRIRQDKRLDVIVELA